MLSALATSGILQAERQLEIPTAYLILLVTAE